MPVPDQHDFATNDFAGVALHRSLALLRAQGPVMPARFGGRPAVLISSHRALAEAFRDNERFPPAEAYRITIEPVQGVTFQTMEGEQHRLYRRLATPAFQSRAVEAMEQEGLAQIAHELIDRLGTQRSADFASAFTHRVAFAVISRMLGIPGDREDQFRDWAVGFLEFPRDPVRSRHCAEQITRYLLPILAERRREPRDDILSGLVLAEVDDRQLTDEEILAHIRLLFSAGASTTTDALGNLVYTLLAQPERWQAVLAQPQLRANAIEELLRFETPVAVLPRLSAAQAVEFHGMRIPASTFCLFAIAAANRDPTVFTQPDVFDMHRDSSKKLLSFGPGPRLCPGMHLARRQLAVALDVVLERLPGLSLRDPEAAVPRGAILRGPATLPVSW
ncbi:MAG: cytochrome P450 [Haliea sp.]|uniref:cytochrome P450 n=1 Tax=Haliea sp. TaxID=1932666 RepID=UPI0032ED2D91